MRPGLTVLPLASRHPVPAARPVPAPRPAGEVAVDVEVSLRVQADGTRISVVRRTVADGAGGRRTVGIEAVIR